MLGCVAVAWLGACGAGDDTPLSASCTDPAAVEKALATAPRPVVLADGTRLSRCVKQARTAADLQNLGSSLTAIGERLEDDPAGGERLGYLIGAVRRGTRDTPGQAAELAHRLERSGAAAADPDALQRGLRAGERTG